MQRWSLWLVMLAVMVGLSGCLIGPAENDGEKQLKGDLQVLLDEAIAALSAGDYETSNDLFNELATEPAAKCRADYGLALGGLLVLIEEVDELVGLLEAFSGETGFAPQQAGEIDGLLNGFVRPFEEAFGAIRRPGQRAVEEQCTLTLPDSLPIELTLVVPGGETIDPDAGTGQFEFVDVAAKIGHEFDAGFLRVVLISIDSVQAVFNYVLAHRFSLEDEFTEAVEFLGDTFADTSRSQADVESGAKSETERQTWVSVARSAGAIFDLNPNLLALRDGGRINEVDDDIERVARNVFYRNPDGAERGVVVDLIGRNGSDEDLRNNVLAIIDVDNDGQPGAGDIVLLGLREADVEGQISFGSLDDGIEITIPDDAGDIAEAVRLVHEMAQNIGNQMEAVEDATVAYERFGIADFNQITAVLDIDFEPIPEVAEFDLRAYFANPIALRGLLPYWYDDGSDFDVFLIEGESAVTTTAEPFIAGDDVAHFPDTITFGPVNVFDPQSVSGLRIPSDGVFAGDDGFVTPFPYIAFQRPAFGEMLYVNQAAYPVAPQGDDEFVPASNYSLNKGVNSLGRFYAAEIKSVLGE